jgi:hypothetical protein
MTPIILAIIIGVVYAISRTIEQCDREDVKDKAGRFGALIVHSIGGAAVGTVVFVVGHFVSKYW